MIRIILAGDHVVMRRGLCLLLKQQEDLQVIGEAGDGREAVNLAASLKPDVAVLDITMPNLNGIEAAHEITAKQLGVAIDVLSMHADEGYVLRALKAGARGYLLKESPESDLIRAIRSVNEGKSFFSPVVSRMLVEDYVRQLRAKDVEDSYELLSLREREVRRKRPLRYFSGSFPVSLSGWYRNPRPAQVLHHRALRSKIAVRFAHQAVEGQ
ncbi:MAG: response regulator transcription factor [Acidobacteriales bacterium]|nr:response regulator transcription factor [Terriglobales bacterium]